MASGFCGKRESQRGLGPIPISCAFAVASLTPNSGSKSALGKESIPIPFIVMEYLGGGDLAGLLRSRPMDLQIAGKLFNDISSALRCAHYHVYEVAGQKLRGVVHRDLKPENICFDDTGRLVVVDFGIARILGDLSSTLGAAGTPAYMAPEQWNPVKGVDYRTDIYALAIVLFQMITGELPFAGGAEDLMAAHLLKTPPDPREWRADLPEGVATAIRRALEKEKEARFHSVEEFAETVASALKLHRVSPPSKPKDKGAVPRAKRAQPAEVRALEACPNCETPGTPDSVGGKLYCRRSYRFAAAAAMDVDAAALQRLADNPDGLVSISADKLNKPSELAPRPPGGKPSSHPRKPTAAAEAAAERMLRSSTRAQLRSPI